MQFIFWCTSFRNAQVCIMARRRIHETRVNSLRLQWRCDEIVVTTHKNLENRSTLMNKRLSNIKGKKNDSNTYTSFTSSVIRDRFLQRTQNQIQTTWPGPVGGSPAWWVRLTWKKCHRDPWPLQHVWEYSIDRFVLEVLKKSGWCNMYTSFTLLDPRPVMMNATNAPIAGVLPQALFGP